MAYLAVENIFIAIAPDIKLDVSGIAGSDLRLGHQESRADLALQQGVQPPALLLLIAVFGEDFHVASIRGGAVGCLRGGPALAQVLGHQTIF